MEVHALELLTETDAAALLHLPKETLRAWRARKAGPSFVKLGALVRYTRADLLAYIERNRCTVGGAA